MRNLLGRLAARHRTFLIVTALVLSGFQLLICAIVGSVDLGTAIEQIRAFAPPALRPLLEQSMIGSPEGMLAFGWNHPITHALVTAVSITLGARAIAGEVEHGAIELILAQPISRARYFAAHATFGIGAITIMSLSGMIGSVLGRQVFALVPIGLSAAWRLTMNLVLLQGALYAITLLLSAFGRENGQVALGGVLLAVMSYLIEVISSMWSKAAFLHPYALHSYYNPREILTQGHLPAASVPVLVAFIMCTGTAAFVRFRRRDLP
jgi:ABC-2 type transport system permease protein